MVVKQENHVQEVEQHILENEEYRTFSYTYLEEDERYSNVYYFDRKKGPYHVTGFLILNKDGKAIPREKAQQVNEAFNLYNHMFRKFQQEWGDVVQQDMRKYQAAYEHLRSLYDAYHSRDMEQSDIKTGEEERYESAPLDYIRECLGVIENVLQDQAYFYTLDYDAIEVGKRKRQRDAIDNDILVEVKRIITEFERTIFRQLNIQAQSKETRDQFVHYFEQHPPLKEHKKSVKKALKMFKRIDKLVQKHQERLNIRKKDPENHTYYQQLKRHWSELVRNNG